MSNLHQEYVALSIYRSDYDGDGVYGTPAQMALPSLRTAEGLTKGLKCSEPDYLVCSHSGGYGLTWPAIEASPNSNFQPWVDYVTSHLGQSILLYDPNHGAICPASPLSLNKCIGVTEGGSVVVRVRRMNPGLYQFFFDP
ncbi:MAG: hypothetical protein ACHQ50_00565 [Fimbriimonadales bacterium]